MKNTFKKITTFLGMAILTFGLLFSNPKEVYALLTDNITTYWKMDSSSADSVGSNNGTDSNSPTYTSGKISNALTLVRASSQYVSFPNAIFPWATNAYTLNIWVKLADVVNNQSFSMTARSGKGIIFYYTLGMITHSKPNVVDLNYTWLGVDTNWHMWTFVGDGSGMRTYLDGNSSPVASNANTGNIVDPDGDTITFGAYKSGGSLDSGWYMDGQQDEIGIWSRALSTTEISQLYNSGNGLTYPFSSARRFFITNSD